MVPDGKKLTDDRHCAHKEFYFLIVHFRLYFTHIKLILCVIKIVNLKSTL